MNSKLLGTKTQELASKLKSKYSGNGKEISPSNYYDDRIMYFDFEKSRLEVPHGVLNLYANQYVIENSVKVEAAPIPDISKLRLVAVDIETYGLLDHVDEKRIIAIGVKVSDHEGNHPSRYFYQEDEKELLETFNDYLSELRSPDTVILMHNGFEFDCPYIERRAWITGARCSLQQEGKGWIADLCGGLPIIDTLELLKKWDKVYKKIQGSKSLKSAPIELELRDAGDRVELEAKQIWEYWNLGLEGDQDKQDLVLEYLEDDLKDTLLLGKFLIKDYWGLLAYFPQLHIAEICNAGTGTLWNILLGEYYGQSRPRRDQKEEYKGALRASMTGLHTKVYSVDIASMYPSIMLLYGIFARDKDPDAYALSVLKVMTEERLNNKLKGKAGDKKAAALAQAQKILLNSLYGSLAAQLAFNDYSVAALVTAYGQEILRLIMDAVEASGGSVVSFDTDSCSFQTNDLDTTVALIQEVLPSGIELGKDDKGNLEVDHYDWFFVPAASTETIKKNQLEAPFLGTKSTYIYCQDESVQFKGGSYTGRDKARWQKEFVKDLCLAQAAWQEIEQVKSDWRLKLSDGEIDVFQLTRFDKVTETSRKLRHLALIGEKVRWYMGVKFGLPFPMAYEGASKYTVDWGHYHTVLNNLYQRFLDTINSVDN